MGITIDEFYLHRAMPEVFARVARKVDNRSARQGQAGQWEVPPGVAMVTLWFLGMVLFFSFGMMLHLIASVLAQLYAGG